MLPNSRIVQNDRNIVFLEMICGTDSTAEHVILLEDEKTGVEYLKSKSWGVPRAPQHSMTSLLALA